MGLTKGQALELDYYLLKDYLHKSLMKPKHERPLVCQI